VEPLRYKLEVIAEYKGRRVLDLETARLLLLVDKRGSLLSASRALGIPYSRAWELISKIERLMGERVIETKRGGRGGGGAKLTEFGRRLLNEYVSKVREVVGSIDVDELQVGECDVVYAGSHDLQLESLIGELRGFGDCVEVHWVGSAGGLASIMLNDADFAGVHLLDPDTRTYNKPYLSRYWLEDRVVLVRGYARELGLVYRRDVRLNSLEDLVNYRLINRSPGSGTRVFLDLLLEELAKKMGVSRRELTSRIPGYDVEARTHLEVASAIARGEADVGVATRWAAEYYGLEFMRLTWENFDFVISKQSLKKPAIKNFIRLLRGLEPRYPGYMRLKNTGRVLSNS